MIRSNGLGSTLTFSAKKPELGAVKVLKEFKIMYSSNSQKRDKEELIIASLENFLLMIEGKFL